MNAIMYLVKTGCQWRMLPKDFPPYNTVLYYFDRWKWEGGAALQAVYCLFAILDTSYPVTDRLYEAVVPSRQDVGQSLLASSQNGAPLPQALRSESEALFGVLVTAAGAGAAARIVRVFVVLVFARTASAARARTTSGA